VGFVFLLFWWVARWRRGDGVLVEDTYFAASVLQAASSQSTKKIARRRHRDRQEELALV